MGCRFLWVLGCVLLNALLCRGYDFMLKVEPNWSTLFTGESVSLACEIGDGKETDWFHTILKDGRALVRYRENKTYASQNLTTWHSGEYQCYGISKKSTYFLKESNKVNLTVSDADVILEYPPSIWYEGESVPLRCRHRTQRKTNASFYKNGSLIGQSESQQSLTTTNAIRIQSDGSFYTCKFDANEESKPVKLKLEPFTPKAELRQDKTHVPAGGNVTLTCSVFGPSSNWTYLWYRGRKTYEPMSTQEAVFLSNEKISVSQGGLYWCRAGRGDPIFYTEYSETIVLSRPVVNLKTNWPEVYYGEVITLTCDIEDGEDAEWEYEWEIPSWTGSAPQKSNGYMISYAPSSRSGIYMCKGKVKRGTSSTEWSDVFTLTLSDNVHEPVLTVSPSWLTSRDAATLTCRVNDPSAGWRIFWYKAVPQLSNNFYYYELLRGSGNSTEHEFYIVPGEAHTSGYACRAGRGSPVYYSHYSHLKFIWSGDVLSEASLTVSPDRTQHSVKDPLSLSCEGNSRKWRVTRLSKSGYLTRCSHWGAMTGSTCNISTSNNNDGVYWCESETGQFSNAVNITAQDSDILLVSPVHPVAEGASLTLSCRVKTENVLSVVHFYKNGKLIQNDSWKELRIPAVSKSDEGFYKCEGKDSANGMQSLTSPESWVSVKLLKPQESPVPVLLIVGLVSGLLFLMSLLVLLYHNMMSKGKPSPAAADEDDVKAETAVMTQL